jgi:hypothetical protein
VPGTAAFQSNCRLDGSDRSFSYPGDFDFLSRGKTKLKKTTNAGDGGGDDKKAKDGGKGKGGGKGGGGKEVEEEGGEAVESGFGHTRFRVCQPFSWSDSNTEQLDGRLELSHFARLVSQYPKADGEMRSKVMNTRKYISPLNLPTLGPLRPNQLIHSFVHSFIYSFSCSLIFF